MKNFISVEELDRQRENCIILDCRGYMGDDGYGQALYRASHIEGALYVSPEHLYRQPTTHGGRAPLPDMKDFAMAMQEIGVQDGASIVVYDTWVELGMAGRLWWMLKYMGLEDVKILLGGYPAWQEGGYPTDYKIPSPTQGSLTIVLQEDMCADYDLVKGACSHGGYTLVDARAKERFEGKNEPLDPRPGHIPGALNLFYKRLYEGNHVADPALLEELVAPIVERQKLPIVYCGSGVSAPFEVAVLDELDLRPLLYVGSMSDWQSYGDEAPIATGDE